MLINGAAFVLIIISVVLLVALIAADWKIFEKAGESGWKSLIPLYCTYIFFKISWKRSMFWVMMACSLCYAFFSDNNNVFLDIIGVIANLATTVLIGVQRYKMGQAFGQGTGFSIGLVLLGPIFSLILGFGGAEYKGIRE